MAVERAASPPRIGWLQRMEQTRSSRGRACYGRCQCQHRWERRPRFGKAREDQSLPFWWGYYKKAQHQPRRPLGTAENPRWETGNLKKTYQCQTEANDKVWDLNRKTEKALETLALLYTRFEQINSDLDKVDKDFDKEFSRMLDERDISEKPKRFVEIIAKTVHDSRETYHRLA